MYFPKDLCKLQGTLNDLVDEHMFLDMLIQYVKYALYYSITTIKYNKTMLYFVHILTLVFLAIYQFITSSN